MRRVVYFLALLGLLVPLAGCGQQKVAMATVLIENGAPVIAEDPDHPPLRMDRRLFGGDRASFVIECDNCPDGSRLEFQVRDFLPISMRMEELLDEIGGDHARLQMTIEDIERELAAARGPEAAAAEIVEQGAEAPPGDDPIEDLEGLVDLLDPQADATARAAADDGYVYPYVDFPDARRLGIEEAWKPAGDEWVSGPVKQGFEGTHVLKFTWAVRYTSPEGETSEDELDPHIEVHGGKR